MFDLQKLIRPNVKRLTPYSSARSECTLEKGLFLDANESPFGTLNRYPDPLQQQLKQRVADARGLASDNIFIGNGSDEVIDLLFRSFCTPSVDKVLTFSPTYGMYKVSAAINDIDYVEIPLTEDFQLPKDRVSEIVQMPNLKLIFICTPNNPTGNVMETQVIESILNQFDGIVVLDEAYVDFNIEASWTERLAQFPNLVVLQTFSKAWGLAAARVGIGCASPELIGVLNLIKPPYNVSSLNQTAAIEALNDREGFEKRLVLIRAERKRLQKELSQLPSVHTIYPSDANFLLIKVKDANGLYQRLLQQEIIVRNRHSQIGNCLRITVGTPEENDELLKALRDEEGIVLR